MKRLAITFLSSLFWTLTFAQQPASTLVDINRQYAPDELKADLAYLLQQFEEIHPGLYTYASRESINKQVASIQRQLNKPMTRLEFARLIIPLTAAFRDGHTGMNFPRHEIASYVQQGGLVFPYEVTIQGKQLFIKANYSENPATPKGTEILSINGVSAETITSTLVTYNSGELESFRQIRASNNFLRLAWYIFGFQSPYQLSLKSVSGQTVQLVQAGLTAREYQARYEQAAQKEASIDSYTFTLLPEQKAALFTFNSMDKLPEFQSVLDSMFTTIRRQNISNLIIDMRQNGGGNSTLGSALYSYITDKPITQFTHIDLKISEAVKQRGWYKQMGLSDTLSAGQIISNELTPEKPAPLAKPDLFFRGKVYLLTSNYTFSSANAFVTAFKCYRIGTIIGQETGGVTMAFGDLIDFKLPNTQLDAFCSCKTFVHPCGEPKLHGVIPDIEIHQQLSDTQAGRDTVLEYTRQLIQNGGLAERNKYR